MHAVILAGGKGVRLRPYTTLLPKPLVPIGDRHSILEIIMRQLAGCGFRTVTLAIGHLGHLIRAYVGDGSQWGLERVDYATEESPLGTIGPLLQIRDRLPEHFLVMNGDILTDLDYGDLLAPPQRVRRPADRRHVRPPGEDRLRGAHQPPRPDRRLRREAHHRLPGQHGRVRHDGDVLDSYTPGLPLGFDELVLDLLASGGGPAEYEFDGYWLDIGRPDDYDRANAEFELLGPLLLRAPMDEAA